MPGGDGTGPRGQGPGTGRGMGRGGGRGFGPGRGGGGGNRPGAGPGGFCICPNCRIKVPHSPGSPCSSVNCPKCGAGMVRA